MPGYSNYSKTAFTKQVTGNLDMKEKDIIRVDKIYFNNDTALLGLSNGILTLSGDLELDNILGKDASFTNLDLSNGTITNVSNIQFSNNSSIFCDTSEKLIIDASEVKITGNIKLDGSFTVINSNIVEISDHHITLASNISNGDYSLVDGAGIHVTSSNGPSGVPAVAFTYVYNASMWRSNIGLLVDLDTSLNGNLSVAGTSTLTGGVTIQDSLDVSGVDVSNNLTVAGTSTLTGGVTIQDSLDVSGVDVSNNLTVAGTSTLTGGVTIEDSLDVSGVDVSNNLTVAGTSTLTGGVTIEDSLDVSGVDVSHNLTVAGTSTLTGGVTITGQSRCKWS